MTYEQALAYIHGTKKFSTKPGLRRIENLLREMGDPHRRMKYVHIAGTNGKGSATAMTASVLEQAGYRTGMFISPYLERFNERMQINHRDIPDEALAQLTEKTAAHIDAMLQKGELHPTEFEIITAMAFDYWAANRCDFVSLEVGMGGRLDATNVIEAPEVAMIMSVSFDHTHYLGDTLGEIAWEKCGIIKPGSDVICYADQPPEAFEMITRIAQERGATLTVPDKDAVEVLRTGIFGSEIRYKGVHTTIPLMGRHQIFNALSVIEGAKALQRRGYAVDDAVIAEGIRNTRWVGRLEPIHRAPYCVIDAAHNRDAVLQLSKAVHALFSDRKIVTVMGMLADKDYAHCIPEVAGLSDLFIATTPGSPRALAAEETAQIAAEHCNTVYTEPSIPAAVDKAFALAGDDRMVLICGSLYVIGEAKTYIREKKGGIYP